jgi:hypothetical protein
MSGLFSGESMCCTTTGHAKRNSILRKPNRSGETRARIRERAHVVERRGEGPGDGAPRGGGGVTRCGDLGGGFAAEEIRRLVWASGEGFG